MANTSTLDAEDISSLTDAQEKVLALLPILPALLSAWGSANIIYMVFTSRKTSPYRRILLGLSCCDLASSLACPWQAFLVPAATSQRVWAIGTQATCSAMGFLQQLFFSNVWYNGMLSIYFLVTVKFGVRESVVARKLEPWMHVASLGYPLITASIGAGMGIYDEFNVGMGCWITNYPKGCGCNELDTGECCVSPLLAWIFAGIPAFCSFCCILISNLLVYCHVRGIINRGRRHASAGSNAVRMSRQMDASQQGRRDTQTQRTRAVATQASLYVAAFFFCYTPSLTMRIMESMDYDSEDESKLFPLLVLQALLFPLQGLFNCLVFVRPTYLRIRIEFPAENRSWVFRRALHGDRVQPTSDQLGVTSSYLWRTSSGKSRTGSEETGVANGEKKAALVAAINAASDENKNNNQFAEPSFHDDHDDVQDVPGSRVVANIDDSIESEDAKVHEKKPDAMDDASLTSSQNQFTQRVGSGIKRRSLHESGGR